MMVDSYHDVIAPIIEHLRDGQTWTTLELTRAIFPEISGPLETDRRMAQVRRALHRLNANGTVNRCEMWQPGQTYKHYGWSLAR